MKQLLLVIASILSRFIMTEDEIGDFVARNYELDRHL